VPLEVLATFNRVKALTENMDDLKEALKDSELLNVTEEGISRKVPFVPSDQAEHDKKTCQVNGFPLECTLDELLAFFNTIAKPVLVRQKRLNGQFSGTAWVEFESVEKMEEIIAQEIKYQEFPLQFVKKADVIKNIEEKKAAKKEKKKIEVDYLSGCLVAVQSDAVLPEFAEEKLREIMQGFSSVKELKMAEEENAFIVQFEDAIAASVVEQLNEQKENNTVEGVNFTVSVVSGDKEKAFYKASAPEAYEDSKESELPFEISKGCFLKFTFEQVPELDFKALTTFFKEKSADCKNVQFPLSEESPLVGLVRFGSTVPEDIINSLKETCPQEGAKWEICVLEGEEEEAQIKALQERLKQGANKRKGGHRGRGRGRGKRRRF
jgi:hypothetical protein